MAQRVQCIVIINPLKRNIMTHSQLLDEIFFPTMRQADSEVSQNEDHVEIECELPGFSKNEINIEIINDKLIIEAQSKKKSKSKSYILDKSLDRDKISAALKNGILNIKIYKVEAQKPKKIKIN
jgi:HSP20 family protein